MKRIPILKRWLVSMACGLVAVGSLSVAQAQTLTNFIYCQFDTPDPRQSGWPDNTSISFVKWWGEPDIVQEWDGTVNATTTLGPNNPGSGSLKVTVNWAPDQNQLVFWQELDGGQNWGNPDVRVSGFYYDLSFDIKFDPSSTLATSSTNETIGPNYGRMQVGVTPPGWGQIWCEFDGTPSFLVPVTNDWIHVECALDPTKVDIDQITGFILGYPWQPNNITGPQTFWIDNVIFQTNLTKNLAPPTLSLAPVASASGLQIIAAAGDYSRNNIATADTLDMSWVWQPQPVTYSLTIANYPSAPYTNFQTHIFLVSNPGTENSPDWNQPNVVFLDIQNHLDGTATATFRYKTNQPGNNAMMYQGPNDEGLPVGVLGSVTNASPLGTWSMTFENDTNITLLAPGGDTETFSFPDADAVRSLFGPTVKAYFGVQPNGGWKSGQFTTFSRVKVTGTPVPIDDNFSGATLDENTWIKRADDPGGLVLVGGDDLWWVTWTLPDLGFSELQVSPDLSPDSWTDTQLFANAVLKGSSRTVKITRADVPSTDHSYFRLVKRVPTRLQVLLPGETNAPDTPTGKAGTPDPVTAGVLMDVVVNACDDTWHVVSGVNHQVQFTTTDPSGFLPNEGLVTLANGTGTLAGFTFLTSGNWTITATDVSDPAIAPGVSTAVTVP